MSLNTRAKSPPRVSLTIVSLLLEWQRVSGLVLTGGMTTMWYCVDWWDDHHVVLCWLVGWPSCGTVLIGGMHFDLNLNSAFKWVFHLIAAEISCHHFLSVSPLSLCLCLSLCLSLSLSQSLSLSLSLSLILCLSVCLSVFLSLSLSLSLSVCVFLFPPLSLRNCLFWKFWSGIYETVALLLCLWAKHCGHSSGFTCGISSLTFWLAENCWMIGSPETALPQLNTFCCVRQTEKSRHKVFLMNSAINVNVSPLQQIMSP